MNEWQDVVRRGLLTGNLAGLTSMAALAWRGRRENRRALSALNAPSHWLWGDRALRRDGPSWRYTGTGVLVHQASATLWGVLYEAFAARRPKPPQATPARLRDAAAATAVAATVDFALTPRRFTPGFEHRLSLAGLVWTYGSFAVGLAVGHWLGERAFGRQPGAGSSVGPSNEASTAQQAPPGAAHLAEPAISSGRTPSFPAEPQ